jgi:hypothetical protein
MKWTSPLRNAAANTRAAQPRVLTPQSATLDAYQGRSDESVPLRDAIARASGSRISDGFISPLDLVEIGLRSAEEAEAPEANS